MNGLKKLLIAMLLFVGFVATLPLLWPYSHYKPGIESAMKERLDTEVTVEEVGFSYLPAPHFVLTNVGMGQKGEASIGQVVIPVSARNILGFGKELNDVILENAQFQLDFARSLPARLKPNPGGRDVHLASIKINSLSLRNKGTVLGQASAVLSFKADGTFKDVTFTESRTQAEVNLKPVGDKFALVFEARNWELPGKYPAKFDQIVMKGIADENGVLIEDINALIYGSPALGQAQLVWTDGWQLKGSLQTQSMFAEPLIRMFSVDTYSTGRLAAAVDFAYAGTGYEDMFENPSFSIKFTISDGSLHNFDLVAPLKSQNPSSVQRGGQTRFDTLKGDAIYSNGSLALTSLALNSGKFTAGGSLTIAPEQKLSGRIVARLNSGAIRVEAPLSVDGTLVAPQIRSSGAYKPGDASSTTRVF